MITLQERVHAAPKPNGWQLDKLHHVFRVRRGNKNTGMKEENLLSLSYGRIVQKDIETSEGLLPENFEGYQIVEPGNIVLRLTDLQNDKRSLRQGLVTQRGIITSAYDAVEVQRDNDPRFWFYSLLALDLAKHYYSLGGGVRQSVKFADFPNDWVYRPDLATQRQIADFLDRETARIDLLIEKKQRLVALLGDKARRDVSSIFEKLAHDNRIWRLKHVLVAGLVYGANEPSDGDDPEDVRYIRITDIDADGNLRDDTFKSLPRERIRDYILEDGDILFARSGATVGKSFIYREHMGECCYAGYLIRARVNTKLISPDFLIHFTSTDQYWNHILGTNIQATIQNVSAEKYANLTFPLPPLNVQREIAARVMKDEQRYAATKSRVNSSIDRLKEYRSALITAAVTGKIDVSTYANSRASDRDLDAIQEEMGA